MDSKITIDIKTRKNLLAFSGGVDSTALFFLLLEHNISFDIAIVDYAQRTQSKDEVIYATQLAHKYNKKCFISTFPKDQKFSEKSAREYRYSFFEDIIKKDSYEALITAHQLNDKLEWFLMQLTKGAGLSELIGLKKISHKENYIILKPLLDYSKDELTKYLEKNDIKYFIDDTNFDQKYKRNYFRHNFSDKLLENFSNGIKNSFLYLENDLDSLLNNTDIKYIKKLTIINYNNDINIALNLIDKDLKKRGIIISKATRDEIKKQKNIIISHKIAISITNTKIFIAPYVKVAMDKKFKDRCRVSKIPANIRGYIYKDKLQFNTFK